MRGLHRRRLAAVAAAVLLVGAAAAVASGSVASAQVVSTDPAGGDGVDDGASSASVEVADFYAPPDPLPAGEPGAVIRSRPIAAPAGAVGWKVLYHSTDVAGNDIAVSGVVYAPDDAPPRRGRPVVAWAHATTGVGDACAPSRGADPAATIPWIDALLDAGYVVAATDYEGLGTAGVHPYLVGPSEAHAVLDSVRAARAIPTDAGKRAVVYGHSQGGHSALFSGELAGEYAPELSLRGVAAGAPVPSPAEFVDHTIVGHDTIGFLVLGALGYQAAYPDLAALPVLSTAGTERADIAVHACALQVVNEFIGDDPTLVFGVDPRAVSEWEARLRENSAGRRRSAAPVLYWQGAADDLTHLEGARAYARRACRKGTALDFAVYDGADHISVLDAARDDVLAFMRDAFAGERITGNCARV